MEPASAGGRRALQLAGAFFAAIWLGRLAVALAAPPPLLVSTVPDDAFYYLQIAANVAKGIGSTFDGETATNGYHPLWLMLLAAAARALDFASGSVPFVRFALAAELLCGAAAAAMLARFAAERHGLRAAAGVLLAMALPWPIYGMADGLESGLVLLATAAVATQALRRPLLEARPPLQDFAFGCALALAFLARLDMALLCVALGAAALAEQIRHRPLRAADFAAKAALWAAAPILTAAIYLVLNGLHFDTRVPISGVIKSCFPVPAPNWQQAVAQASGYAAGVLAAVLLWRMRKSGGGDGAAQAFLAAFALLLLANSLLFMTWAVHAWHFTAVWPLLAIGAGASAAEGNRLRWVAAACAPLAIAGQVLFFRGRTDRAFQARSLAAAEWARTGVPAGVPIGMSDCGVFGYFRGGDVVNLDGVVNNLAYQERLSRGAFAAYAEEQRLGAIAHHAVSAGRVRPGYGTYPYTAYSRLHRKPGGTSVLHESDELYRSPEFDDGRGPKVFVIWRLSRSAAR